MSGYNIKIRMTGLFYVNGGSTLARDHGFFSKINSNGPLGSGGSCLKAKGLNRIGEAKAAPRPMPNIN